MRSPRPAASIIAFTFAAVRRSARDRRAALVEVIEKVRERR
jgi:hypothetical protein